MTFRRAALRPVPPNNRIHLYSLAIIWERQGEKGVGDGADQYFVFLLPCWREKVIGGAFKGANKGVGGHFSSLSDEENARLGT